MQDRHAARLSEGADGGSAAFGEHLDGARDEAGAAESRLADRSRRRLRDVVVRPKATQVHDDGRRPHARERARRHGEWRGADPLPDVGEARAGPQPARQRLDAG